MAVTTSPTYHRSPIHDGFATIRSARSRIKTRNLANVNTPETVIRPSPPKHAEYFTLRRNNKKSFLENNNDVEYFTRKTDGEDFHRRISLNLSEPIYAKVTPPTSPPISPCQVNGHSEVHYDSIDIKPSHRISRNIDFDPDQTLTIDRRNNIVKYINGDRNLADKYSSTPSTTGSDRYSDTSNSYRNSGTFDEDITSYRHSYTTETNTVSSENSELSNVLSSDTEDVLKDLPSRTNYHRSPQKYATLNSRRPRSIEFKSPTPPFENSSYGSLQRNGKVRQFHSEPNTPVTSESFRLGGSSDQPEVTSKPPIQRNGFRRSVSDNNGFATKLNYRHSFSVDSRNIYVKKPHTCCECVTGIPAEDAAPVIQRTLDTLYETAADQKVGCQTILRPKPPVPWWELAIKKTRYKSCPILDEAHVVSAFEQSLSNMTQRLQQLTATAERKDSEVTELRQTIELLRKQSIQAGLTTAHMQSMGIRADGVNVTPHSQQQNDSQAPTTTPAQQSSPQRKPPAPCPGNGVITRHLSTDSVSSINSISSGSSAAHDKKLKKKGWLRSSFTKAFSRNAKISKTAKHSSLGQLSSSSGGGSARYDPHTIREGSHENSLEHSHEIIADGLQGSGTDKDKTGDLSNSTEKSAEDAVLVDELKRQLREKDLVLTDIRLEALSSAHQLESLKDTVVKMRNEMLNLKQNNERLQRMVTSRSLAGSQTSIGTGQGEDPRRFSLADQGTMHQNMDIHPQPLDFNCITSTPTNDFTKKLSPISNEPIYGNNSCELTSDGDALLASLSVREGDEDMFSNSDGMRSDRMSGGEYVDDIDTLLPPPKSRELAIGESYSDMGGTENQGDTADGKKIAIAVYLGQPDTFQRYFEEVQDTLSESEVRFYQTKQPSYHTSYDSPRISQNHSPESENQTLPGTQDYSQSITTKSNTNSLKSNKSNHSTTFKNMYSSDTTINTNEFTIAYTYISGKTTWQNLDYIVRKTFKDYLSRIDPGTNLGLNTDSITSYHLGDATRGPEISFPELLPCGYIVGTVNTLYICLQGVGSLAFDSLIPKNIVYRYISLLSEHRRVILCGPSGTGKSYLATKLAEFYVRRTQRRANPAEAVATFNVERKSAAELRAYLGNIAEQCGAAAGGDAALPSVLLLDNLQHASALGDAFVGLRASHATHMPVIIGTMSQATCNTTNLQLQHNFRWLLTSNHMEPVKGFLARYLRRKLVSVELERGARLAALGAVLEWLPGVWQHLNAYLEAHSSSDVAIGPRLFLACPMDLHASQVWFAEVWNYSVVPYVRSAVREGVALYGRRRGPPDPLAHVKHTYPWREPNHSHTLLGISLEDIGLDETTRDTNGTNNQDPLLNMLMRLQEAANYSGEQSQDSDNISLDSNLTHDSSAGNEI